MKSSSPALVRTPRCASRNHPTIAPAELLAIHRDCLRGHLQECARAPDHHECVPSRVLAEQGFSSLDRRLLPKLANTAQFAALVPDWCAQFDPAVFNFW